MCTYLNYLFLVTLLFVSKATHQQLALQELKLQVKSRILRWKDTNCQKVYNLYQNTSTFHKITYFKLKFISQAILTKFTTHHPAAITYNIPVGTQEAHFHHGGLIVLKYCSFYTKVPKLKYTFKTYTGKVQNFPPRMASSNSTQMSASTEP